MSISVICPLYKGEKYIKELDISLKKQKNIELKEIKYIVTKSKEDKTVDYLKEINATYELIEPEDFSHSLTREKAAYKAKGDIIVFITQDIKILDDDLKTLIIIYVMHPLQSKFVIIKQ